MHYAWRQLKNKADNHTGRSQMLVDAHTVGLAITEYEALLEKVEEQQADLDRAIWPLKDGEQTLIPPSAWPEGWE